MTLLALQSQFRDWLKIGSEEQADLFPMAVRSGLDIYQNNYRAQLATCLEESFPVTLAWLGGEAFHVAVVAHVEAVPPSSWTLDLYPRDFPATVRNLYPDDPEITDLAVLELALGEAFVALDTPPLAADLGSVDWDVAWSCLSTQRMTFGDFCNASPDDVDQIGRWLGQWIADGIIAQISESIP